MFTNKRPGQPGVTTGAPALTAARTDPKAMRRSSRLTIDIPVEVICKGLENKLHSEHTRTIVVSAHGCALPLQTSVLPGDKLVLIHKLSRQEITCRVIMCRQSKNLGWDTGVEFIQPAPKFWHIAFPPDDWDPSFRECFPPPAKAR